MANSTEEDTKAGAENTEVVEVKEPSRYGPDDKIEGLVINEKALVRKLDWHILPPLSLLYLLCYLDRTYEVFAYALIIGTSEAQSRAHI
jgi:hypothetical protein